MASASALPIIARKLVAPGKGILAADESIGTCGKRFQKYGIPETPEMRRKWRGLLFSTPGIEKGLSGVILFDETIRQETSEGEPFAEYLEGRGVLPGIKVDQKTEPLAGSPEEELTKGLEGLPERLREYVGFGAKFTKWRAVIRIKENLPTDACIEENARRMAAYAKESQRAGLVPVVEPEVLLDGVHTLVRSEEVIGKTLRAVFREVKREGCDLSGLILKSSMALPGKDSGATASPGEIAEATLRVLLSSVPKEVPGILFLSGGATPEEATERLNEIVKKGNAINAPWPLTFSYSRALQDPVLAAWRGKDENAPQAQAIFAERVAQTARVSEGRL
ncbi:MAG: fructose-bisphosphate aldolase, class I [Parcubacteria group bacterium Greene0416_79]|nr:MAG: fructose-bisphosphate aldolase, class I [Parcubacteria group bacterium Greene0416_79]